ncbi:MAG: PspC domain-containing protein [Clostridia bacterium]|nr:PspC domain-containing protein [Clostridia bacterium]MBO5298527.1 PspC domain-containing protein [Clostridia bacterium]MBQ2720484.1 PspC domain-containing protein [Clostridia bacterium]MBQ4628554.1 PspC domain-containing protein [Clostridia bacterium]
MKRLLKSSVNRKLCGVCGGVGEYFDIDPTLIRIIWVVAALCGTLGFWAYLLCALIIPNDVEIK